MTESIEFGRIKIDENVSIVVRKVVWQDKAGIDIRTYLTDVKNTKTGKTFSGWSKNGIRLDPNKVEDLVILLNTFLEKKK